MTTTDSIHIVRKYGRAGGMENYVWELTHALNEVEQRVTVLCEDRIEEPDRGIRVICLGSLWPKPRYLYQLRFSRMVGQQITTMETSKSIIHSHERTAVHDVTTFHGPPIKNRRIRWTDIFSPRIAAWEFLEYRELCAPNVRAILPNSNVIADQLRQYYPQIKNRIREPAFPGVAPSFANIEPAADGKVVGFIGREWKRKGLPFALDVVRELQQQDPEIKFIAAGCEDRAIDALLASLPGHAVNLGWTDTHTFLSRINLLIHPARAEPFGMVVAEANAAGIPVVVSKNCGIAPLIGENMGTVLGLSDSEQWVKSIQSHFAQPVRIQSLNLNWPDLAKQHIALYLQLLAQKNQAI